MAETTTLKLTKPISGHEGEITSLEFAEPTYREYSELGEVTEWQASGAGQPLHFVREAVVAAYIERCIRPGGHAALLPQLCLHDAREARSVIMGFFRRPNAEADG